MGKSFNAEIYRQLEKQTRQQERDEDEREQFDEDFTDHATRLAAEARGFGVGEWYAAR